MRSFMERKRPSTDDGRKKRFLPGLIVGMLAMGIIGIIATGDWTAITSDTTGISPGQAMPSLNVLLLSSDQNSQVEKALRLDGTYNVTKNASFTAASLTSEGIDVVVLANYPLANGQAINLSTYLSSGGSIFMIWGPDSDGNEMLLQELDPTISVSTDTLQGGATTSINYTTGIDNQLLLENVQWSSCPSVRNHSIVAGLNASWNVFLNDNNANDHPFLASYSNQNQGRILLFTIWATQDGNNYQVELWPYFNYFIYLSTGWLAGSDPATLPAFATWPYSPVPHATDTTIIAVLVTVLGTIAFALFFVQRAKSRRSQIEFSDKALTEMGKERISTPEEELEDTSDPWEQVGTHKQISGFLFGLFAGILLGIPQIVLTGIVFPRWIMPFPQVAGWFDWIKQFFQAIWMLFDVGTSIALAKYFSQYRIKQPRKAVHYIQIFVWWQVLSGVIQIVTISLIGSMVFPQTNFAHLSWMVVLHSLIQYPGFFVVFQYVFQGMQRTDLQNLSNLLYQAVLMLLSQYAWILIFRFAFKNDPLGEAFWSGIGYCVGQYVAEWGIFFIMMGFYKKLGFSISTLFRVDFTRQELKEALVFGGKEALGHVWVPLAYGYQVMILGAFLPNYNEEMGLYGYANMLMQVTALVGFLTEGFLAPVSEAHSHKKQQLLDFTLAQGIKWANFIIFYMIALLGAIGQPFIVLLAGSNWLGAARFVPLMLVYYLMQPWAWLGDKALAASGYTGRAAIIWIVEQGGKMLLLSILIVYFKDIMIILWAHVPVLGAKIILSWLTIRHKVGKPKAYLWNSWVAPGAAAVLMFIVMLGLTRVFTGWFILVEFILAIFVFLFVYSFLCGFFGCYDRNTIREYEKATKLVGKPVNVFAVALYKAAALGCKVSPGLHGRFPIQNFDGAMAEARELEREKLKLKL